MSRRQRTSSASSLGASAPASHFVPETPSPSASPLRRPWCTLPNVLAAHVMSWLGPRSHIALAHVDKRCRAVARLASASPAELHLWCEPWTHASLRDATASLRHWRPRRLVLRGTRDDHAFRRIVDVSPPLHEPEVETLAIRCCTGLGDTGSVGGWAAATAAATGALRLTTLDMRACTIRWSVAIVDLLSRLTGLRTLRVHSDADEPNWVASTVAAAGFARALGVLAPTLLEFEVAFSASRGTLAAFRDSPVLRSLRIGRALWAECGGARHKRAVADATWTQVGGLRSLTSLHLPLQLDVRVALPRLLEALPSLHDLGACPVGTREPDDDDETDPAYEPPTSIQAGGVVDTDVDVASSDDERTSDDDDEREAGGEEKMEPEAAHDDDDDADPAVELEDSKGGEGVDGSGDDIVAVETPIRRSALSRVWWYANSLREHRRVSAQKGDAAAGEPRVALRTLRNAAKAVTHLPDVLALSELRNLTLAAHPHAARTRIVSRWPACFDAQHLATLTLERVTWCNERRFALREPKGGLFHVLDHAWLPALRTLALVEARLVPENVARLVHFYEDSGEDNDYHDDGGDDLGARRPATERETEAARSPLYVAPPHTSLGVLARIRTLILVDSLVCAAVMPRCDGVTRLEFARETRADMGELARRFPALRDLVVGETALRHDTQPLTADALPPTPRIGDTPVWASALAEACPGLRTLAVHESEWPRDPTRSGAQCCPTHESCAGQRPGWLSWLEVVVGAALRDDQSLAWSWHASESVTSAAPSPYTTCCHDAPSWAASPTPPCAQAAGCVLEWYRAHAPATSSAPP